MLAREGEGVFSPDPWGTFSLAKEASGTADDGNWFFANLESPFGERGPVNAVEPEGYNLCGPEELVKILKNGGVDLVSTANNHREDCGSEQTTHASLAENGIRFVGSDMKPVFLEWSGGCVGIVAADDILTPLDRVLLFDQIAEIHRKCETIIVSLHWGMEYQAGPTQSQRKLAQELADAGVDVFWGHHPHVLEPVEWLESSGGNGHMLAIYSLGNLLADQWMAEDTQLSALMTVRFQGGVVKELQIRPFRIDRESSSLVVPDQKETHRIQDRIGLFQPDPDSNLMITYIN